MGFKFEKDKIYEMPVFFGPSPDPKNPRPDGETFHKPADVESAVVMFETDAGMLEQLLPDGFSLAAPVVSVAQCEFKYIGNFSGNSYTLINISVPTRFDGKRDHMRGDLVLAMYENHAEPIMGGRELLGYSKIYADIPSFAKHDNLVKAMAFDWGFKFLDLRLDLDKKPEDPDYMARLASESEGKFNWKYIQACPEKGQKPWEAAVDCSYPVVNPGNWKAPVGYPYTIMKPNKQLCSGTVKFYAPTQEDMPMSWWIPAYLAKLPIKRYIGASHTFYNDPADYTHIYRLR
jgi:hypothetical protein